MSLERQEYLKVGLIALFLKSMGTADGQKNLIALIKALEPYYCKTLLAYERMTETMFEASTKNPILALPATLAYTNFAERFRLMDTQTAQIVATTAAGFEIGGATADLIGKFADAAAKIIDAFAEYLKLGSSKTTVEAPIFFSLPSDSSFPIHEYRGGEEELDRLLGLLSQKKP